MGRTDRHCWNGYVTLPSFSFILEWVVEIGRGGCPCKYSNHDAMNDFLPKDVQNVRVLAFQMSSVLTELPCPFDLHRSYLVTARFAYAD